MRSAGEKFFNTLQIGYQFKCATLIGPLCEVGAERLNYYVIMEPQRLEMTLKNEYNITLRLKSHNYKK